MNVKMNSSDLSGDAMLTIIRPLIDRIRREGNCDPWIADGIGSLSVCDLKVFGRCVSFDVEVSFDAEVLGDALKRVRHARSHEEMVHEFLLRGASNGMLRRLFGLSKARVEQMKVGERIAGKFTGRLQMLPQGEREAICARWLELAEEISDLRERYLKLAAEYPGVMIGSLHRVILQGKKEASRAEGIRDARFG